MRILEINKFNHVRGGADKHFVDLVELLEKNGNEVAVFAMNHPENNSSKWSEYFVSRVDYEKGSFFNKLKGMFRIFWSPEAKRKIARLLDEFRPEVVHIHNIYHQISPSILPEIKKRKIPVVMTVHDWKLICPNYLLNCETPYCKKCVAGKYWHCVAKKCVKNSYLKSLVSVLELQLHRWLRVYDRNVDHYITPSNFVKNVLVEAGFSEKKISVLPHFIETNRRGLTSTGSGASYALYVGRVSKEKGADELIDIFSKLSANLVLAGSKDASFLISDGQNNIRYVGFRSPKEIGILMQNAYCVVSASRLPETFGLIALEAIASQKPFVGYRTGAYGEIVQDGKNGFLAENREELEARIKSIFENSGRNYDFNIDKFAPKEYYSGIIDIFRVFC
jgi:glycosyltransferase involved in cell wall biosynthesis